MTRINDRKWRRKPNPIPYLSVKDVASKYGFSVHTVYNWVSRDGLPAFKRGVGNRLYLRQADVDAFIEKNYEPL